MNDGTPPRLTAAAPLPALIIEPPCGPNLEYDNDFLMLQAQLQPAPEVQYGAFTMRRDGPDWARIERQCLALLARTLDIRLLVWLVRCRTQQAGAPGLAEGLALLASTLACHAQHIHPQPEVDGLPDVELRANALSELADPEGLLADLRALWVNDLAVGRLSVRDVERALAVPRLPDALPPDQVLAQLQQLEQREDPTMMALAAAGQEVARLILWTDQHLQGRACDLGGLARLLEPFGTRQSSVPVSQDVTDIAPMDDAPGIVSESARAPGDGGADPAASRQEALAWIARARQWFDLYEPSSPVGVLLRQAERLVGKRYSEVAAAIPMELLLRWDAPPTDSER